MPPQPPPFSVPDSNLPVVPGARNLIASELLDGFVLALATARGAQAQTTLAQLAASPQFALTAARILKALQPVSGASGDVLTSNGLLVPPSFQPPGGGPTPSVKGRAVFVGQYGSEQSELIVSDEMYTLCDLYQTFGKTTWTLRTDGIPPILPTTDVEVRVDGGMHGVTRGEHPAAGLWDLVPGADPNGVANPTCFEILASTFVPGCFFTKGHMYVSGTQFDAAAPLNALTSAIPSLGPGTLYLPPGCMWAQSNRVDFPANISVVGHGGWNTTFVLADTSLQPVNNKFHTVIGTGTVDTNLMRNVHNVRWQGWRMLGNRARQRFGIGGALADLGGSQDATTPFTLWIDDWGGVGAAGYLLTMGGHNTKQRIVVGRIEGGWSDSDFWDCKNRDSGNTTIFVNNLIVEWWAMGDQGTNLRPDVVMAANSILTDTSNPSVIKVPLANLGSFPTPGDIVTVRPGATSGNGINPVGSWNLISTADNMGWLDVSPQVATGTGGIGGATPTVFSPNISPGDVVVDTRGLKWIVAYIAAKGMIYGRNGPRQRGGIGGNAAGIGGVDVIFGWVDIDDLTPAWVATTTGICRGMITLLGPGGTIQTANLTSTGGAVGVHTGATASNARVDNITTTGMSIAVSCEGDTCVFRWMRLIDSLEKNIEVFGATLNNLIDLDPNPASGSTGSHVVIITCPKPHGQLTGDKAGFIAFVNSNGSNIRPSNTPPPYSITVINPTQFSIVMTGVIIDGAVAWGGPNPSVRFDGANHTATDNEFHHVWIEYTQPGGGDGVIGFSNGTQLQTTGNNSFGQADGTVVNFVRDKGSEFPNVDYGTNTDYVIGNSGGIPNRPKLDVLDVPALSSASITNNLVFELTVDPAFPVSTIDVNILDPWDELLIELEDITHNSGSNQNWGIQVSTDNGDNWLVNAADYGRIGTSNAGKLLFAGGVNAGEPVSGLVQFTNFNLTKQRTEAWINAGRNGDPTSVQNCNGFVVVPALHNALRILPGLNQINGGTVRVYAKQGGDIGS